MGDVNNKTVVIEESESSSPPSLSSSGDSLLGLSQEQKERMERNREAARQRRLLKERTAEEESLLGSQNQSNKKNGFFDNNDNTDAPALTAVSTISEPAAKKAKRMNAKESEFMTDLRNVCSQGSIVRVHGTKLIDTGGGFLIEEQDLIEQEEAEKLVTVQPAPLIPSDVPICEECGVEFAVSFLFEKFDYPVCDKCKDTEEKHKLITRTDAKNEYLLKDVDFDKREPPLKFICRPNPHNSRWGDMKLYLRQQVEKRALEIWESLEKIAEQIETREENRVKSKVKKYNKNMESLRMSARSSLYTRDLTPHEHKWGPDQLVDEDEDMYKHKCTECGQEETFEKM